VTEYCAELEASADDESLSCLARKVLEASGYSNPYRKPTQVVEESILRRSSDPWLRN
jgi:hypothetical protein